MKKKRLVLSGALTVAALSVAIFAQKPLTAEEALLLANVEAIAQNEGGDSEGSWTIVGTSTDYWVNGRKAYTVLVRDCLPGGPMPDCTPAVETVYY